MYRFQAPCYVLLLVDRTLYVIEDSTMIPSAVFIYRLKKPFGKEQLAKMPIASLYALH